MAKKDVKDDQPTEIQVLKVQVGVFDVAVLGMTPLILHHGSVRTHLLPAKKLTRQERDTTLKHEPIAEYRDCMIMAPDGDPTRLLFSAAAFKGAMERAAVRLPGVVKTEIEQLVQVDGVRVSLFGLPKIFITEVRLADMARTPDARTRPILPSWACRLTIRYVKPMMTAQAVANLLAAAGLICGVGDWRPEKGGTHGQFEIVDEHDARYQAVLASGQATQDEAIKLPVPYDAETLDTLTWYDAEVAARSAAGRAQESRRKPNGKMTSAGLDSSTH